MKTKIQHLSVVEAEALLDITGIPCDELERYKPTIVAGNIHFWDELRMQDWAGILTVIDNKIFRKRS